MASHWRSVRVFISSTFRDMQEGLLGVALNDLINTFLGPVKRVTEGCKTGGNLDEALRQHRSSHSLVTPNC